MNIDWAALGEVFGVSLVVTVALVGVFTLGIVGTSAKPADDTTGAAGAAGAASTATTVGGASPVSTTSASALARSGAYLCFALCAAAVGYGIHLIVA
ncbi:hypothetical protein AAHZ94_12735 [Streptomyces sp. HSW2009]|uniref:hypothetical protein n=1 Tax=Streptomyces sp. HSW2009 TaxID=3142890 RepID=UPI0032EDF3CD